MKRAQNCYPSKSISSLIHPSIVAVIVVVVVDVTMVIVIDIRARRCELWLAYGE